MEEGRAMKEKDAIRHLREFMLALQRYRSIVMETVGPDTALTGTGLLGESVEGLSLSAEFAAEMWPWVFGDKCPLPVLVKILDSIDDGGTLVPLDYYNQMFILDRFMPEVKMATNMRLIQAHISPIPDGPAGVDILSGWDSSSNLT